MGSGVALWSLANMNGDGMLCVNIDYRWKRSETSEGGVRPANRGR